MRRRKLREILPHHPLNFFVISSAREWVYPIRQHTQNIEFSSENKWVKGARIKKLIEWRMRLWKKRNDKQKVFEWKKNKYRLGLRCRESVVFSFILLSLLLVIVKKNKESENCKSLVAFDSKKSISFFSPLSYLSFRVVVSCFTWHSYVHMMYQKHSIHL